MGTPVPPRDDENEIVAFAERTKLRSMAMSVPNSGEGSDGWDPPNDCDPIEVAPLELRTTLIGAVKSCATLVASVEADHRDGAPTTERKYPAPCVISVPASEPLKRPVHSPDAAPVGRDKRME